MKRFLKFMFGDQSDFSGDPYGLFLNEIGHAIASLFVPFVYSVAWGELTGELPHRVVAAGIYFVGYVAFEVIKCRTCKRRMWIDSLADTLFSTMGLSVAIFAMRNGTATWMNFDFPILALVVIGYTAAAGWAAYDEFRRTIA